MTNLTDFYVVTAATGNIGKVLVKRLLEKHQKVRALARNKTKLNSLEKIGAEIIVASVEDPAALTKAFTGAKAVFTLIPPNYRAEDFRAYQNKVSEATITAIKKSGVKYVVNLSSIGANLGEGTGPINGLHDHEERLNKLEGVNVLHLRPASFMENLLMNVGLIRTLGIAGSPLKPDLSLPMIATKDIAEVAAEHLLKLDFAGKSVIELHGQRDLTMAEAAKILGKAIGRNDLRYVQFPYGDALRGMLSMGLSEDVGRLMIEMQRGMNDGTLTFTQPRSAKNTTSTSIEEFAEVFAAVYNTEKEKVGSH